MGDEINKALDDTGNALKGAVAVAEAGAIESWQKIVKPFLFKVWAVVSVGLIAWTIISLMIITGANRKSAEALKQKAQYEKQIEQLQAQAKQLANERTKLIYSVHTNTIHFSQSESNYENKNSRYAGASNWRDALSIYRSNSN